MSELSKEMQQELDRMFEALREQFAAEIKRDEAAFRARLAEIFEKQADVDKMRAEQVAELLRAHELSRTGLVRMPFRSVKR